MKKMLYCASNWAHVRNFHLPYVDFFSRQGYEVHVVASGIPKELEMPFVREFDFQKRIASPRNLKIVMKLAALLKTERYDVIYVHTSLAAFLCRLALAVSGKRDTRLVYLCHGYFFSQADNGSVNKDLRSLFYLLCEKLLAGCTDTLLLMNHKDYVSARRYGLGKRVELVHGIGLVKEHYPVIRQQDMAALRQLWGIPQDAVVYCCVGEFSKRKNQQAIIQAFSKMQQQGSGSWLLFAGDGALLDDCRKLAQDLQLGDQVIFCGQIADMWKFYAITDVLVTASVSEGLPFCVMEALHYGIPVIASEIKGHIDLLTHGKNSYLFKPNDEGSLITHMERLQDIAMRSALAGNSYLDDAYYYQSVREEIIRYGGFEVEFMPLAH